MESLKNSFEHLKNTIISSNPNPWYSMMIDALGGFENEFNQHLATVNPTIKVEEPVVIEEPTVVEEPAVVKKPVVKKTTK
jgi:UDP-3-O-[3-hydroxymyristoyl] glucosamine N-acyltransferase